MPNTRATAQRRNRTAAAARRSRGHWGSTRSARATARHTPGSRTPAPRPPACRFRVPRRSAWGMAVLFICNRWYLRYHLIVHLTYMPPKKSMVPAVLVKAWKAQMQHVDRVSDSEEESVPDTQQWPPPPPAKQPPAKKTKTHQTHHV